MHEVPRAVSMLAPPQLGVPGLLLWKLAVRPAAPFCQAPPWPPHLQPSFRPLGFCSSIPSLSVLPSFC